MADIAELARIVDDAARKANAIKQLSAKKALSFEDSYAVQSASIKRRVARGEKRVGIKMGFTSRAKMVQMGIDDMIWGRDVVADNASSSGFVIGPWQSIDVDISNLGMLMEFNGRARQIGSSAAILGQPIRSLVAGARLSAEAGEPLQAGWIVMAGGATAAEALSVGDYVRNSVQRLGSVAFSVGK
jgi:2-keto-4-pentenoate hydratase